MRSVYKKGRTGIGGRRQYFAVVNDSAGFREYVYGTYVEIEDYCNDYGLIVDKYLKGVDPDAFQKGFRYVGFNKHSLFIGKTGEK